MARTEISELGRRLVVGLALAGLFAGCGAADPGPTSEAAVTPAAGRLILRAKDVAYSPMSITMTSDTALTVVLDNQDAGVPHDAVLYGGADTKLASTDVIVGIAHSQFSVPPLVPGRYRISCTVHPNMTATLTVVSPG